MTETVKTVEKDIVKISDKKFVKALKKAKDTYGIIKVTHDLGYRSQGTLNSWFKNNAVPNLAKLRIKNCLDSYGIKL